ncbi:hypothetical protein OsI_22905 [Oryza sativa Indica Group]|uniref:DUF4057 domain-containing protein n=1 Tax=Oryza sativa subsp. indica TaxID=39946 RepID=B8B1R4_ORYSI|nr:hypothetical protein OsI_22905 [Oryza sativa Indica Group]
MERPAPPPEAISKVVFGGQVTEEEFESLNKRKPCSAPLWKEMTGSGIFAAEGEVEEDESSNASAMPIRTSRRHSPPVLPLMSRRLAVSRQAGSFSDVLRHCGRCYLKLFKACISFHYC